MKFRLSLISLALLIVIPFSNLSALPISWNYNITINSHVVLIQPTIPITIDGVAIEIGDFIGVFYLNSTGGLNCGGYLEYQGIMAGVSVWPEDVGNDGFQSGDAFIWKIWDSSTNTEYIAEASYDESGAFPNSGFFLDNGMSGLNFLQATSNNLPWNYNITGSNHSMLIPVNALLSIDGDQISHGDYLGVFYDSAGVLTCGGYVQWLGYTTSFSVWGEDIGNDGFAFGENFNWKIWDSSTGLEHIAHPYYMGPPMPDQGNFAINGMSGIDSLKFVTPPWNYTLTANNHTILVPFDGTYLINTSPITTGDFVGVFYDSLGTLVCGGYAVWEGVNTTVAAWGEDNGNDGFISGEPFKWKIWDSANGIEHYASATYLGSPLPNQGTFVINGMSGIDSLLVINNPPDWNFSITGTNHTILIPDFGNYSTLNGPIDIGDFIGVFYDSLGVNKCGGYIQWFGLSNTIAAWGADIGYDGFATGEEFVWKIWDTSVGTEFIVEATYLMPPAMPNSGQFAPNGMSGITALEVIQPAPPWTYINTGSNHSVLISENTDILINNIPIEPGDYIGIFYDSLGTQTCAGFSEYNGLTIALTAWGEDLGDDGFSLGEEFNWMIWDASEDSIWMVYADYDSSFPNQQYYAPNGISSLINLTSTIPIETQDIFLNQGWGIYSTYITPLVPNMDSIFINIVQFTEMCKDADGSIYWPAFSVNLIGDIEDGEGYLIKMASQQVLSITGDAIIPEITGIILGSGWDIIAYLRKTPASISSIMNPIISSIELIKDGYGNIFWPQYFLDLIGNMNPGQGYQIKMIYPNILYYPANTSNTSKSFDYPENVKVNCSCKITANNMTIGIPINAWPTDFIPANNENILIFDESGNCSGAGIFNMNNFAVTLWGDDEYSENKDGLFIDERFHLMLGSGEEIIVEEWEKGSNTYMTNKISIAGKIKIVNINERLTILDNYPNPFNTTTSISYYLPVKEKVNIRIHSILGEEIRNIQLDTQNKGIHLFELHRNNISPGTYIFNISIPEETQTIMINII